MRESILGADQPGNEIERFYVVSFPGFASGMRVEN
jgi:hypothetical protein